MPSVPSALRPRTPQTTEFGPARRNPRADGMSAYHVRRDKASDPVHERPLMSIKLLIYLDLLSIRVHYRPRPSPGYFRDTRHDDGTQNPKRETGNADSALEPSSQETAVLRRDRSRDLAGVSPQQDGQREMGATERGRQRR